MSVKKRFSIKFIILSLVCTGSLYGLFFYSTNKLQQAGYARTVAKQSDILIARSLGNLPFSGYLKNESELSLVLAYHILHQESADYKSLMTNGGKALKMYREVAENDQNNDSKYANYALLEICNTLFRMPWSEQLKSLAQVYASKLNARLSERSIDLDDQATAHENLAIFFLRMKSEEQAKYHASIADSIDAKQFESTIANGFNFLRSLRMALARCMEGVNADIVLSRELNKEPSLVLTADFFRNQHYHSWDVALLQTVKLSSKEDSCKSVVETYQYLL